MYPHRVMTRRRRMRTRTLVLSLAAALAGAVVLPALGRAGPGAAGAALVGHGDRRRALRRAAAAAGHRRAGGAAGRFDRQSRRRQDRGSDAATRPRRDRAVGIVAERAVPLRQRAQRGVGDRAPRSDGAAAGRARGRRRLSRAQALSRRDRGRAARLRWARPRDRRRGARRPRHARRAARRPGRRRAPVPARPGARLERDQRQAAGSVARPARLGARHRDGRHRRRPRRPRRPARRRARCHAAADPGAWSCSTAT